MAISLLTLVTLLLWWKRLLPEERLRDLMAGFVDRRRRKERVSIQKAA
jgi:hypothetical protein